MQVRINTIIVAMLILWGGTSATYAQAQKIFEIEKSGTGSPLILIPGLICGGDVWERTVDSLREHHECHVLTLAGFAGVAPLQHGPYLDSFKNGIIEYIQENDFENVSLIGHSLGGFLSLLIGLENMPEVKKLIIVDALPFLPAAFNPDAKEGFDTVQANAYIESLENMSKEELGRTRKMVAGSMSNDSTSWNEMVKWAMQSDLKTEAFSVFEMMGRDLRDDISTIKAKVHVFVPYQENPMAPQMDLSAVRQMYASQYSSLEDAELKVIENAKHFIMLDQPQTFIKELKISLDTQ